jgi:hypothetical protein
MCALPFFFFEAGVVSLRSKSAGGGGGGGGGGGAGAGGAGGGGAAVRSELDATMRTFLALG